MPAAFTTNNYLHADDEATRLVTDPDNTSTLTC